MELAGRVALITGGGSGMGRATARRLAQEAMDVCVVDIDGDAAQAVAEPLGALAVAADVSDSQQVDGAFRQCVERFGAVDLAYLNAGVNTIGTDMATFTDDLYRRAVGVNVDHVVYGTRAALRAMRDRKDGRSGGTVVVTASIAGIEPFSPDPIYTLTKHAVVGFIRAIAPELATHGIGAHVICPGVTDTGMVSEGTREFLRNAGVTILPVEEIAEVVVRAATSPLEATGSCWVAQADAPVVVFEFNDIPGGHRTLNERR